MSPNIKVFLVSVSLLVFSTAILAIKTKMSATSHSYIQYGYDSARILGHTTRLLKLGEIDPSTSNRIGLPIFSGIISNILNLDASETLLIPLWLINTVSGLILFLLAYSLTHNITASTITLILFAVYSETFPVNNSHFFSIVLSPLRFLLTLKLIEAKNLLAKTLLSILLFASIVLSNLTYPILSLFLDFILLLVIISRHVRNSTNSRHSLILLSQVIGVVFLFLTFQLTYTNYLSFQEFSQKISGLNVYFKQIPSQISSLFIFAFILTQTIFAIFISKKVSFVNIKLSSFLRFLRTITTFVLKPINSIVFPATIFYGMTKLVNFITKFSLNPSNTKVLSESLPITSALVLSTILYHYLTRPKKSHKVTLYFIFNITLIYLFLVHINPISSLNFAVRNERIVTFMLPFILISLGYSLTRLSKPLKVLLLTILLAFYIPFGYASAKHKNKASADTKTLRAMNWFNTLPDHSNVLVYAQQIGDVGVAPHEKPETLNLTASIVPYYDQETLAKCDPAFQPCAETFRDYIRQHNVKFLIIEKSYDEKVTEELLKVGKLIYKDQISIIQIW